MHRFCWGIVLRGASVGFLVAGCSSTVNVQASGHDAGPDATASGGSSGHSETGGGGSGGITTATGGSIASGGSAGAATGGSAGAATGGSAGCATGGCTTACDVTSAFSDPTPVPGGVNTTDDELAPRLSDNELDVYLARRPAGNIALPTDLYLASRATISGSFDAASPLGINSTDTSDGDPMLTSDGATLFFSSDRPNGLGEFDLYWSTRSNVTAPFTSVTLVPTVNSDGSELQPFYSSDGELWFSYRKAGFASPLHLRRSPKAGLGFSTPIAVTELDSPTDDMWPVLTRDKLTIYYSSTRSDGGAKGKADIWVAHRSTPTGTFDPPTNVAELNSAATDLVGWISADNCRLYFASNRSTSTAYDIYVAKR